jgi:bacterioferritin (cytochrome b1)
VVKEDLERKRQAREELQRNILSYFTEKDPYYREMLELCDKKVKDDK